MTSYRIVEQIGDITYTVRDGYPSQAAAMLAAVDLVAGSDEERDLWVDGPLTSPVPVGCQQRQAN
jgi:hypothetical protein